MMLKTLMRTRLPSSCRLVQRRLVPFAAPFSSSRQPPRGSLDHEDDANEDEEDDESGHPSPASLQPWKTLLEFPARAAWRVSRQERTDSRDALLSNHGNSHLTKKRFQSIYHDRVVTLHKDLANIREAERKRAVSGSTGNAQQQKKKKKPPDLLLYGREEAWASARFRFRSNFAVTQRVLEEARALQPNWKPRRVLDFGIGCGSATAASLDLFGESVEWVHGIDPSQTMQEAAEYFLRDSSQRLTFSSYLSAESGTEFDLILCAYTVSELPYGAATLAAAALLWERLAPNGILVFIEPGTPDGFASIRTIRNLLLAADKEECQILAPCTHKGSCPMERFPSLQRGKKDNDDEDDEILATKRGYCSFVQSMPPREGRIKSEKFSYLVMQKKSQEDNASVVRLSEQVRLSDLLAKTQQSAEELKNGAAILPEGQESHNELVQAAVDLESMYLENDDEDALGLEFLRQDRSSFGRIIHAPRKHKGHVLIECCAAPGKIARYKISRSMSKSVPGIYAAARKSRWGGFWPDVAELEG
jgi:ribosomal protein RSM22 (predicted rRNA methylase)